MTLFDGVLMIRPSFSLWDEDCIKPGFDENKNAEAIAAMATTAMIPPIIALFNGCFRLELSVKKLWFLWS